MQLRDNHTMKILFDFLPIALFFGMFKYAEGKIGRASCRERVYVLV